MANEPDRTYLGVLFDRFPTGILIADDRAYYVDANQEACALLNRSRDQIVGHHLSTVVAPGRQAEVDVQWRAFVRDGLQQGMFEIALPDGKSRVLQFNARANFAPGLHCSFLTLANREPAAANAHQEELTLCSWSKRVFYRGEWLTIEEYLLLAHGLFVRHGMSPGAFTATLPKPKW